MPASDGARPSVSRIALVQKTCSENKEQNLDATIEAIKAACHDGARIICLQELFNIRYPCQSEDHRNFDHGESIPGPTSDELSRVAREKNVVIVGSIFERRAPGVYHNTAIVLDGDGTLSGKYRKMHIPDDPLYYEKFYFTPGDLGFQSFDTSQGRIGVCICWDQWFPEAARLTALAGAEIIFYPTAIGWLPDENAEFGQSQHSAWETVMRSHSITNGVFVAATNRVGTEDNLQFWGGSFISDPNGNVLVRASQKHAETVVIDCNLGQVDAVRTHWPFLRDRRIDAYGGLLKRYLDE